jgi:peptidoglycan/LPS O-acetylase OafA/YrhL
MKYSDSETVSVHKNQIRDTYILDVLRGLAALYVLIGHSRWLLWEGYSSGYKLHPETYSAFGKIAVYTFSIFNFGHEAVMLFFVLSGFVIQYSSYNQYLKTTRFSISSYLLKRIKRIYPPFLFALLLTWVLDTIGKYYGYSIYTGNTNYSNINENIFSDTSWQTLLGNLFMVQKNYTPVWGSNGPLWSLMYEWWFYILYVPVFFINKRAPLFTAYLVCGCFLCLIFFPISIGNWLSVLYYFFAWYMGVFAADLYMDRIKHLNQQIWLIAVYAAVIVFIYIVAHPVFMKDIVLTYILAVVIYVALYYNQKLTFIQRLQPLSEFSYTLYVIHVPLLVLISGWLQQENQGSLPKGFGWFFMGIAICLVAAWCIHLLVEKPFIKRKTH